MDLREVLGMGMKLGVKVSDNTKAFFKKTKADVVLLSLSIGSTSHATLRSGSGAGFRDRRFQLLSLSQQLQGEDAREKDHSQDIRKGSREDQGRGRDASGNALRISSSGP